jgi:hypothetical protein
MGLEPFAINTIKVIISQIERWYGEELIRDP